MFLTKLKQVTEDTTVGLLGLPASWNSRRNRKNEEQGGIQRTKQTKQTKPGLGALDERMLSLLGGGSSDTGKTKQCHLRRTGAEQR